MTLKPEPPPEGAVNEARKLLVRTVAADLPTSPSPEAGSLTAQEVLESFDTFIKDYQKIIGTVFDGTPTAGIRLALVRGLLSEILESMVKLSGSELEELRPFILAGRITGSISPERAEELIKSQGFGHGDVPEILN